jgi:hypothetical protein
MTVITEIFMSYSGLEATSYRGPRNKHSSNHQCHCSVRCLLTPHFPCICHNVRHLIQERATYGFAYSSVPSSVFGLRCGGLRNRVASQVSVYFHSIYTVAFYVIWGEQTVNTVTKLRAG